MSGTPPAAKEISPERLNHIALARLAVLRIPAALDPARGGVAGELPMRVGSVVHPTHRVPIGSARFTVVGHDSLAFVDPPLSALGPVRFYDAESLVRLEERVASALEKRVAAVRSLMGELSTRRMEVSLDVDRLLARGVLRGSSEAYELLAGPDGVRLVRVTPTQGKPREVGPSFAPLKLEEFPSGIDLELFLADEVTRYRGEPAAATTTAPDAAAGPATLTPVPAAPGALTLGLLAKRFGAGATLTVGKAGVEVFQELQLGATPVRFTAVYEAGTVFKARLNTPTGERWADRVDAQRFPGVLELATTVLGVQAAPAAPPLAPAAPVQAAPVPPPPAAGLDDALRVAPQAGELWMMNVLVERAGADEVRYTCVDVDDRPYGAARVLKRAEFENAFIHARAGWRLCLTIDAVEGDQVVYRQLDARRQPRGSPKRMPVPVLTTTFRPVFGPADLA